MDADITIGRYDPATVYSNFTILNTGVFDTVRVTLRRDSIANSPVSLFFARIFGINNSGVSATATAVLQKVSILEAGTEILPFAMPESVWNSRDPGDQWSIYSNGGIEDESGGTIPGNWGTLDIGNTNNSTADLTDQILNGLRQSDLDVLYNEGRINSSEYIESDEPWISSADTGLSSGIKNAVQDVHGKIKLVPIYDSHSGESGENLEYHVVGWGVVKVIDSHWNGENNTSVKIQKLYTYDGSLKPQTDLSNDTGVVDGAYTSPVLVQ